MRGSSMRKLTRYSPAANPQQIGAMARNASLAESVGAQTAPETEMAVTNVSKETKSNVELIGIRPSRDPRSGLPSGHVTRPLMGNGVCQEGKGFQNRSRKTISRSLTTLNFPPGVA